MSLSWSSSRGFVASFRSCFSTHFDATSRDSAMLCFSRTEAFADVLNDNIPFFLVSKQSWNVLLNSLHSRNVKIMEILIKTNSWCLLLEICNLWRQIIRQCNVSLYLLHFIHYQSSFHTIRTSFLLSTVIALRILEIRSNNMHFSCGLFTGKIREKAT